MKRKEYHDVIGEEPEFWAVLPPCPAISQKHLGMSLLGFFGAPLMFNFAPKKPILIFVHSRLPQLFFVALLI